MKMSKLKYFWGEKILSLTLISRPHPKFVKMHLPFYWLCVFMETTQYNDAVCVCVCVRVLTCVCEITVITARRPADGDGL